MVETLINANELFDVPIAVDESINAQGLQPIEKYNIELERVAKDLLPLLERSLSLLLSAHDDYNDLFKTLDEIGLAHYADPLKQILSEGVEEGEEGDGKGQSWGGYLKTTFTGRSSTARIPVILYPLASLIRKLLTRELRLSHYPPSSPPVYTTITPSTPSSALSATITSSSTRAPFPTSPPRS